METAEIRLNGHDVPLSGSDPSESLLRWLNRQRLTGTKEGCADGDCGACTVAIVDATGAQPRYRAVNSCLLPIGVMAGREIVTVGRWPTATCCTPCSRRSSTRPDRSAAIARPVSS
jgi:xanthine dehydrogenase iron-sulfur cluster and FAD-binding subunit A